LKSLYRKRNRAKVNAYNRVYRSKGKRPLRSEKRRELVKTFGGRCERCGEEKELSDLVLHHIKPLRFSGDNEKNNFLVLCDSCHKRLHLMWSMDFWKLDGD